jgi:hypothetical protein
MKVDFDPGPEKSIHTPIKANDVFLMKVLPDGHW